MQRTFVAISLALAFSCAFAVFTPTNYVKNPVQVIADNETNYTNATGSIQLASVNSGELDLVATSVKVNSATPVNTSANAWSGVYRKLDSKVLTSTANTTLNFTAPLVVTYTNGYAVSYGSDNDTGIPQLTVYQIPVNGGASLARITLSNNTYAGYTPLNLGSVQIGKNIYIFHTVNNTNETTIPTQVNVTSFTVGSTTRGSIFNLTTTLTTSATSPRGTIKGIWGESLGTNQLYVQWLDGTTPALKYATVDVTKGTVTANTTGAWNASYICRPYATDKKWYGDFCYYVNTTNTNVSEQNIFYFARSNTSSLAPLNPSGNASLILAQTNTLYDVYSYGPYLTVVYTDSVTSAPSTTYSYDIWNLDTYVANKNKTTFLVTDLTTTLFKVQSAGLYSLSYQHNQTAPDVNGTVLQWYSSIQVGQVQGASYLTSVLGFIMTIIAGVLLF